MTHLLDAIVVWVRWGLTPALLAAMLLTHSF